MLDDKIGKSYIKIKQIRSTIGQSMSQRLIIKSLGLGRIGKSRILNDTKSIRGMIIKMQHLLEVKIVILKN